MEKNLVVLGEIVAVEILSSRVQSLVEQRAITYRLPVKNYLRQDYRSGWYAGNRMLKMG